MDLNYLYFRRGMSFARAGTAACAPSRAAHLALATGYGDRIAAYRSAVPA